VLKTIKNIAGTLAVSAEVHVTCLNWDVGFI